MPDSSARSSPLKKAASMLTDASPRQATSSSFSCNNPPSKPEPKTFSLYSPSSRAASFATKALFMAAAILLSSAAVTLRATVSLSSSPSASSSSPCTSAGIAAGNSSGRMDGLSSMDSCVFSRRGSAGFAAFFVSASALGSISGCIIPNMSSAAALNLSFCAVGTPNNASRAKTASSCVTGLCSIFSIVLTTAGVIASCAIS